MAQTSLRQVHQAQFIDPDDDGRAPKLMNAPTPESQKPLSLAQQSSTEDAARASYCRRANPLERAGVDLVQKVTVDDVILRIKLSVEASQKLTISCIGFHAANSIAADGLVRRTFGSLDMVLADGIAVLWASAVLGRPLTIENRIGGDITMAAVYPEAARHGWGVYFLGGAEPDTAFHAARRVSGAHPGLNVVGTHPGYLTEDDTRAVICDINQSKAVIVVVGMGQPRQEEWIVANKDCIDAAVFIAVGGYFDHVLKNIDCYPAWVYTWRLNWAYRLGREPRRLLRRYTVGLTRFALRVLTARIRRDTTQQD